MGQPAPQGQPALSPAPPAMSGRHPVIAVDPGRLVAGETVRVVDLGGQYALLLARRIRELGVYAEVVPPELPVEQLLQGGQVRAVVLSGGPASVHDPRAPGVDPRLWEAGAPVLGVCYGMQLMARDLGGRVEPGERHEFGRTVLKRTGHSRLLGGPQDDDLVCWMSHSDVVVRPPAGFQVTAASASTPVAAMEDPRRALYGVQFHPEVAHTPFGTELLRRFLFDVAGLAPTWAVRSFLELAVEELRRQLPQGTAVVALSGGVDSATAAALVHRAIGDRLVGIFVDHGLLRAGEPEQVRDALGRVLGLRLVSVAAGPRFLQALAGVSDPEAKRRIVGREFVRVFEEQARELSDVRYLVQGTLYPDVVESGGGRTATIKSHHNVGGLPDQMGLTLVEPLRYLFKDEVRRLALELGLPPELVHRHPFPGPGLAVRIVGPVSRQALDTVRAADAIVQEELRRAGLAQEVWQAFAVWTGSYSVGVKGDARAYGPVVAVRCVTSQDGMTADWVRLPYDVLDRISHRITNEVPGVSRVVYDISPKPPATIEWE